MGLSEDSINAALESVEATAEALKSKLIDRQNGANLRRMVKLIAHNSDSVITKFDPSKIKNGIRGRYGFGFYFSSLFKNYDYGPASTFINAEPLNLLNANMYLADIKYMFTFPDEVNSKLYTLEELLVTAKNNREYNEIKSEIEKLDKIKSKFDKNSEYISRAIDYTLEKEPQIRFDAFLESRELRVQEANRLNMTRAVMGLDESMNNLILMSGYDGINVDGGREIMLIPQEKLNDLLVPSQELFISEKYHEAKADGSNPELVGAVEKLLGQK